MAALDLTRYKRLVQGFFDPEPKNDRAPECPIWCLGVKYEARERQIQPRVSESPFDGSANADGKPRDEQCLSEAAPTAGHQEQWSEWPKSFLDDHESRFWITYRSNMPPIAKSIAATVTLSVRLRNWTEKDGFTSDTGWGCMIRSGQSLLANCLSVARLGRCWQRHLRSEDEKRILSYFVDDPAAPFSIHKFVDHGAKACGKHPGEWFGPSATARCIQSLTHAFGPAGLRVYVNADGADVYQDQILKLACEHEGRFTPVLILLGVRLGIDQVTPAYWETLKHYLRLSQSMGIAGGRPSSSHYFIAYQGDEFFYLDPHFTRPAIRYHGEPGQYSDEEIDTYHTRRLRRLSVAEMDPSMLLAFLIKSEDDWKDWREEIEAFAGKPIVHIADHESHPHGRDNERPGAIDEVETFDDDEDD